MKQLSRIPARSGSVRRSVLCALCLSLLVVAAVFVFRQRQELPPESRHGGPLERLVGTDELRSQVTAFCGDCHALPSPAGFPKQAWHDEVKQGYDFYFDSGRTDLKPPDFDRVVAWFRDQAPESIVIPQQPEPVPGTLRFRKSALAVSPAGQDLEPTVSFIKWSAIAAGGQPHLLWCDMRSGDLRAAELGTGDSRRPRLSASRIDKRSHPAHAEPCDLDGDGRLDLVVADLGSFQPADHADGKVVWLRRTAEGAWEPHVLLAGLGRVADVRPGDFDGDGDLDLLVAEFGWRATGKILLLENQGEREGAPAFESRVLDLRHGTIHVIPSDLDGDGTLDFVALISQEHETVVAFLNDSAGDFRRETVFSAHEPAFGSSGIQLVDLDADGDLDVLYTNGDTFDSFYPKPYHSVRWLENQGRYPFEDHRLTAMPGVHRALAGDLDGDGDLDIVACALLPRRALGHEQTGDFDSLLWLEQTAPGEFRRYSLERGSCMHAAMEVGDFDGDGRLDLAVGNFSDSEPAPAISIWWNLGSGPDGIEQQPGGS